MMKKMLFVLNPRSGRGQIRTRLLAILDVFVKAGYEISVHVTQAPGDARRIVRRRARGKQLVVVSGGDGTLNEALSGLMDLDEDRRPALGYIPSGSTNDYAASLGLPHDMKKAAALAVSGTDFAVDAGRFCEERYFAYVAAFGAFTEVSYRTPQETKNLLGHQAYMLEAVRRLTALKSYRMRFEWEGGALEDEFLLGMVTNTVSIGGFKGFLGREVALNDGKFEVLLIRRPRTPKDVASIASWLITREGENECVSRFSTEALSVSCAEPVDWTLDGEYGGARTQVAIRNCRQAVRIRRRPPKSGK